jgi:hypothetical protein
MSYPLLEAFADGIRATLPFADLPATTRPTDVIHVAHNSANLSLRLPLHHLRLGKPRPKSTTYSHAIQAGLAILASFAHAAGTRQIIVRIADRSREAISFQPRPASGNWTRVHAISPALLHSNFTDPLPRPDEALAPAGMMAEVSTRGVVHMAGKTALAMLHAIPDEIDDCTVTYVFDNGFIRPHARAVLRPLEANKPAHIIELAQ